MMTYPNRGLLKAAMGHYLTESARTALEALEPEENVIEMDPKKQMPTVGPNQILDMPLFTKIPFLPGSNTMFYTTNLSEKLYQPSATFDLNDPYCKIMAPKYKSLHDPHLRAYYKRKDNLQRLKKDGHITDKNKVVCTLKEFNEYRQYLTSLKLEFEKHYIREQKMLEKQVTRLQDVQHLPEGADTSKYRDWLLKEERPTIQEQENVMRNRYLELINQELAKLELLAEENRRLAFAQDDKKKQGVEKRKQLLLRKKMEEEWRKKEMMLLMKIGDDVKREARIEDQRRKSKEDKLRRKQAMLEKKMAYHLRKLEERFQTEGLLPPDKLFLASDLDVQGPLKKLGALVRKSAAGVRKPREMMDKKSTGPLDHKRAELQRRESTTQPTQPASQASLPKAKTSTKQSLTTLTPPLTSEPTSEPVPSKSATSLEQGTVLSMKDLRKKGSLDSEPAGEPLLPQGGGGGNSSSKVSFSSAKDGVSMASSATSNNAPLADPALSVAGSGVHKVAASASGGCISNEGAASGCGSATGCGSKTSCCGSAGCGTKSSCCGSAGCGSKTSCCGSAGCGSKTSCCGSAGCGSKTSCCSSAGCGGKTSCCGGCCSHNGKAGCCGSRGCGSTNGKAATGGYDSSGSSSKHGGSSGTSKVPFSSSAGVDPSHRGSLKPSTKATASSTASRHSASEGSGKAKQKKRATLTSDADNQVKEKNSSKKRRVGKSKIEHLASTSQDNEDSESSYSAYLQHLLSNSDQSAIRDSLKGKVSASELNSIVQNIMTWVVSAVTSILYPALTKFEERVRTRVYTISEESALSSDNSSSCSSCNEDLYEAYRNLLPSSARKVSFTDTSIKPTVSSPSEFHTTSGKPMSLLSSKSSYTSFTRSTHMSVDSDLFKGRFKRGKTAIFLSPSKHTGLLSSTASMRSSKSDSHIFQMQKAPPDVSEKTSTSYHGKRKYLMPRGPFPKADTTNMTTTDTEGLPFAGGEHKPPRGSADQKEVIDLKDLKSIFANLKSPLSKITSIILDDIFTRIVGDLGFTACSVSISMEVLLESISESLLGSHPAGSPEAGSVSRIASFVANDLVENVLNKLHSVAQKKYAETVSRDNFAAECKARCIVAAGKHTFPDPTFWKTLMPLSLESVYRLAEEIVQLITAKLQVFSTSSRTKVSQFELCAKIKAIGIPLEQLYAAVPPHTVESEAANAIVKDTIRKIVSKTVASSETNTLQYVEEMIGNILSYIQRQMSPEGIFPRRESSILLQLINDVFNDLSTEKLCGVPPTAKPRASLPGHEISTAPETRVTTPFIADKKVRKPFPPVNVPGMAIYSEAEIEKKEEREADGTISSVSREQKLLIVEEAEDKVKYESFGLESQPRSRPRPKSALQGDREFLDQDRKTEPRGLEKTESCLENLVQDAIFCSLEAEQTTAGEWTLEQALRKMEEDFKDEEKYPIVQLVQNLLNEMFQHVWAEQTIWPPKTPASSCAHVTIHRQQADDQPTSKGQPEFSGQAPITDSDVHALAGDLVKTAFQKISCATQTDSQGIRRRQSSLVITDILPLNMPAEAAKGLPAVHFRDPEMSYESGSLREGTQPPADVTEDPAKTSQPEHNLLSSKSDLANDLVHTFIAKLESFVTSKVESQLCLDVQNLKTSISSEFSSAIQQELKRILANQHCLEDIFNSYNNSILAEKEKMEQAPPLSHLNLKSYAQEVAKMMLKSLKHGLDKEMENISTPPVLFSESIAASQIVNMVLTIFVPRENLCESQNPSSRKQSVLEKLLRKNPAYKKDLQFQIQNMVETFLNEIYQTIMLEVGSSPPEKLQAPGVGETQAYKVVGDDAKKPLSRPAVAKSDVSLVSCDLVNIVLEDLSSGLAAGLNRKGPLSARLQSLIYDLIQGMVEPFAQLTGRGAKDGPRSHFPDAPGLSKAEKSRKMGKFGPKLPNLRDFSPEGITKYVVDNISLRLEMFAEEKLESELVLAAQRGKQGQLEEGGAGPTHGAGRDQSKFHGQRAAEVKAGSYCNKAKLVVQDSQSNLRLCAEKLTCTILKVIQNDLEREMLSCQNILPYEENASANELVNDLLKILSVQIALTENEVQKRVLKRIFRRQPEGQKGGCSSLARVEDVLNQVTQRIMGDLGHLTSFNNESLFLSSESKSSSYNGVMETVSQANSGAIAGDIVDGVLSKMYSAVVSTLFSTSGSKSEMESWSSNKLSTEAPCLMGKSDLQKMTLALSQLQPPPRSLGEELVQSVLNKIACFAASNLEEVLPLSMQQKRRPHSLFQCEIQGMDGTMGQLRAFPEDPESSVMRVSLSKSDLTVYAKDVVSKVLGTIIDDFKMEDYHRTILRVNTLSSQQVSIASDLVHSVVRDLHTDDLQIPHLHKHASLKRGTMDGLPSTQMYFQFELSTKDARGKPKGLFYEDFSSYLKQVLPKEGILREIFERQPLTDANINKSLKMLQVAESIVSEVFMRTRDLEASVCILKKTPGELSERLFCSGFKKTEAPGLFHSDSQAEIGSVARDMVASVFENVQRCLVCSVPATHGKDGFLGREDRTAPKGPGRILKHRFTQPEFPFYNVSLKSAMDTIDKIAKEAVECIVLLLETFVARQFRRDFKCNFLEIVKFPLESLSFAQLTRSLDSLLTQVGNVAETTLEPFRYKLQGATGKETLPTLGSTHNFLDFSKLGGAITRECIETAIQQVQMLHTELSVYANNAVSGILEIIKHTLDQELAQKDATLFSSSSESLVLSETISVMLDRCNESLTEITSELMVENLQLEMSGRAFAKGKTLVRDLVASPGVKTTSKRYRRVDLRDSFPPIHVPGMVIYSEEEAEVQEEESPSKFPPVFKYSEWDSHVAPERSRGLPCSTSPPRSRPPARRRQNRGSNKFRLDFLEDDWLPRQSSIPEGSILEKLFKKTAEWEAVPRLTGTGHLRKAGLLLPHHCHNEPFGIPESICHSAICPLKLGHTAETIVNTLLGEFGLESEPVAQAGCYAESKPRLCPLVEKPPLSPSVFAGPQPKRHSLLCRWEGRLSDSSEAMAEEESYLLAHRGSSMLSKWESKQSLFRCKSPEFHRDLQLLACSHVPDPCEIQLLANHIVLSVIKELIDFQPRDALDEKAQGTSLPTWKQELIQSESRWLQERIWRCTYLPPCRKQTSCLDVFWEPLTQAVVSRVLLRILNPGAQNDTRDKSEFFESSLSMFCTVDSGCPEHAPGSPQSTPINIEELAHHVSEVIVGILCEQSVLQECVSRKAVRARRHKYIHVPPLCLADFDEVFHPLVKEVGHLLSMEIEARGKYGSGRKAADLISHQPFISSPRTNRASRGDCRGPGDVKRTACLSTMGPMARKKQKLSCIASNLDSFIHSLKSNESKHLVNKVLHIILDSLWSDQPQSSFTGPFPDAPSQNMMPYRDPAQKHLLRSSVCPHANRLSSNMISSNLGLSPKSVVLLDVVSEKLIRALLDKCITTEHFASTFAFDEFPEEEQFYEEQKWVCDDDDDDDDELGENSSPGLKAHKADCGTSVFTYGIKYAEEPWGEVQSGVSPFESTLDILAHTLVKPVMTELSLSLEHPGQGKSFSKKAVGFAQATSRKGRGQGCGRKHSQSGKSDGYCSLPRSKKPESKGPIPGRRQTRKSLRGRNTTVLETAMQRGAFSSRPSAPIGRSSGRKPYSATCTKRTFRREMVTVTRHGDHSQLQPGFTAIYSALFLEEVISLLLIKIFSSLRSRYGRDASINLHEMNSLFVNALVEEFKRAGVGILQRAEAKAYFPLVDSQTVNKIVDSILREFGFQLAADGNIGMDIESLAERAAEIILTEILDYQLPPPVCRKLPQSTYKTVQAEKIIQIIEHCICFPKVPKFRQPPPAYVTILSQKYLERVINQLLSQLFPPSVGALRKRDKRETPGADFDELSSYMITEVMKSISKHKIWVAKKDDRCRLHSEKEVQGMAESLYRNVLKRSGSQTSVQKDVKRRNTALVDSITSFIIQEVTNHHLQTFLSKDESPAGSPDTEALSENIVRTVLDSIGGPPASRADVFPAKFLEEIVSRVLSKLFCVSMDKKETAKGQHEAELGKVAKKLASSINLQFGRAAVTGEPSGGEQSLGAPLTDVMDDVVDSVCNNISREREMAPEQDLSRVRDNATFGNIKRLVEKGISDYLLHPLFSGDLAKGSPSSTLCEDATKNVGDEFEETQEVKESQSPFSTFLSSGFLKDLITGLLSKVFPSMPLQDAASSWDKRLPSESDLSNLSTQLLNDVRKKLLKHEIRVTTDTNPEQCDYSEEDVQNMTDSLCSKIIQRSGSLEAVQREVRNKSIRLIDRIAGFLVGDILQQHVQPFVSREEQPPAWDRAAAGDSMGGLAVYRTAIKPLDLRQAAQEKQEGKPASSILGEIISELLSKISDTFLDIPLSPNGGNVGDTAVQLVRSLPRALAKARLSVQEGPEEQLGSSPGDRPLAGWRSPYKDTSPVGLFDEDTEDERDSSPQQTATFVFEEAADHLLQSACSTNMAEGRCLIQEKLMADPDGHKMRPSGPYTTVLSYPVLEAIVDRLLSRIFPSSSSATPCSGQGEGPLDSELHNRQARIKEDIMAIVLKQAIWASTYGDEKGTGISEKDMERMVESVYCDVLHEVLLQQPFDGGRESLSNLYVTQIACFIINEMFKYHLQSVRPEGEPPHMGPSVRDPPGSWVTVFPCRLLEDLLNQLLEKIFPTPESIAAYVGNQADFSEADFVEMAANLKSYVVMEISAHQIQLENVSERIPNMDQETEDDIANSVYNQILQTYQSQGELQKSLMEQGHGTVHEVANLLIREILNFHLHPFLSGSDASKSECAAWQKERQPFSQRIYSALFLEDIVVAFFCKILSSPNILAYSKDSNLSEHELRVLVIELVNALVTEFKMSAVKVVQSAEEDTPFPQIGAEGVVHISNSIYEKLLQIVGSEFEIFKAFQNNGQMLAEKLALLIIREISGYQFLPLFTGDTSSYLFSFLEADTIVDRVETILPEPTSSGSVFGEMFVKILGRIFPSRAPGGSLESTVGTAARRILPLTHPKEDPGPDADKSIQNLVENIYKTICVQSGSPNRMGETTAEEVMGLIGKTRQDYLAPKSHSPPGDSHPSSTFSSKTAGWTIHHVKLGDGEPQSVQVEDGAGVYSSSFLKDIFSGLVSKLLSSTTNVCTREKKSSEPEPSAKNLVESILKEFAKSPVKVLQLPEGGQALPAVGETEVAKIIHASLCGILQDRGSRAPACTDKESSHTLAERLASAIRKEILGYQIQGPSQAKVSQGLSLKPFEFGEMAKKVLMEVKRTNARSQVPTPHPLLVSQRCVHDVLAVLLARFLPLPTAATSPADSEDQCAEFDFIHMKLLSKVMAGISKDKNTEVQYLNRVQPNRVVCQTVANSIYSNLLPEFGTPSAVEKCIKAGCTILSERITDFVIKEISGNQMQAYFMEEQSRQQEADEAERMCGDKYGDSPEAPEGETPLQSHLKGLSSIIIEEVAAKLLSKMFHSLPLEDLDAKAIASVKEVAKKIVSSLQGLISKNKLKVWQQDNLEDLGSEDSRVVGEVVDSVYTDILKHSSSEASLYEDLTNKNVDFVNRVACVMVSEISKRDFQSVSESEEELPNPSAVIKLESEKIVKKFLSDMELEEIKEDFSLAQIPTVPVIFLEEILSRFLTTILLAQYDLGFHEKNSLSKTNVNEIVGLLKTSVEKEISKNKIGLVASDSKPTLDPQYEEMVNQVVHSVITNILEKSGSQKELYNDMTTNQLIFPEQVASIIINEVSNCTISNPLGENVENETFSALELDRIVSKVLSQVSSHMEVEGGESIFKLSSPPEAREESTPDALLQADEMPVNIIPYIGNKPLKIDPYIISDHLAVLSIKTEPLEKLKKTCLAKMGMSLTELRRASASGKSLTHELPISEPNKKKERRPSLDMAGRLGVKPKEAVCRNSFQSLTKPDITRVELLKDVESKQDLILRLVAHDIEDHFHHSWTAGDSDEEEEQVLTEHKSFYFKHPHSELFLPKTSSSISRKKSLSLSKCCPMLSTSSTDPGRHREKKDGQPPPQAEIMSMSMAGKIHMAVHEASTSSSPTTEASDSLSKMMSSNGPAVTPESGSEKEEPSLEKAAVGMHLSRDTEEMSGHFEITSVYQDKKIKETIADDHPGEDDPEEVLASTASEAPGPPQQRASVFGKVSSALSRVFSRTSTTTITTTQPQDPEKALGDHT